MKEDTIAAVSTPLGEGGIGIVRISGPESVEIGEKVFRHTGGKHVREFATHTLHLGKVIDTDTGQVVDEVLLTVMKGPRTFTGEDIVEINCHGGAAPLMRTLEVVLGNGARLAEPGEFSKRAFLNGKIDLAQAEAIIDVIRAKTGHGLQAAVENLEGSLSKEINKVRSVLSSVLGRVEVNIDFPGEDPTAELKTEELDALLAESARSIKRLLSGAKRGKILREGIKAVIVGKPNVGKSSLLNALIKEKRAIVTEVPGTTRDVIEEMLNVGGIPIRIMDTAGIHEAKDEVEKMGVARSRELLGQADIVLVILDASTGLEDEDLQILNALADRPKIVVINKKDLNANAEGSFNEMGETISVSAKTGEGLNLLEEKIRAMVLAEQPRGEGALITRVRHEDALKHALGHLEEGRKGCRQGMPLDIISIDIREAWTGLGEITGETASEEILDRVFSEFCIGK